MIHMKLIFIIMDIFIVYIIFIKYNILYVSKYYFNYNNWLRTYINIYYPPMTNIRPYQALPVAGPHLYT